MSENAYAAQSAVTVIGLGQMGSRLAEAFLAGGHATTVWSRTPAKADGLVARGAVSAASAGAAATASPLIVVCLPQYWTVHDLLGPLASSLRGRALVNLTSGTPDEAAALAAWAADHGIDYLDGAAMSGTQLVGHPEGLFLFSGSPETFATHRGVLESLGNTVHLGADPALAPVYDTALFGLAWGALAGYYHAVALVGAAGVDPAAFAGVAAGHMPFVSTLMLGHARQIEAGAYPDDDGTVDVHAAAIQHLIATSRAAGVDADVPELIARLLARAVGNGQGASGIASVRETMTTGDQDA